MVDARAAPSKLRVLSLYALAVALVATALFFCFLVYYYALDSMASQSRGPVASQYTETLASQFLTQNPFRFWGTNVCLACFALIAVDCLMIQLRPNKLALRPVSKHKPPDETAPADSASSTETAKT